MNRQAIRSPNATVEHHAGGVAPLRQHIRQCHTDLDKSAAMWLQTPLSSPLRLYLHALCIEDVTIQSVLRDDRPLFASFWPHLISPADTAALALSMSSVMCSGQMLRSTAWSGQSRCTAWPVRRTMLAPLT